jgi:N-acetylglucosamine kinase-like BadF-type ATPase
LLRKLPDPGVLLAVDGGGSKADLVLADLQGKVLAAMRRSGSYHFGLDRNGSLQALSDAVDVMKAAAGLGADHQVADVGVYCLAGADLPVDDRRIAAEIAGERWTRRTIIRNDTFAVLRAGTDRQWGVAVVGGTGMNCAGVSPDGRSVRFPAFGELSGDRAHGGGWLGRSALGVAIRAGDKRGPHTSLESSVPAYFNMAKPTDVMEAVYLGKLDYGRLSEVAPVVFTAARSGDRVAQELIEEMAAEVVVTACAAIRRLHVTKRDVHVVLGGGVLRAADDKLVARIQDGIREVAPRAEIRRLEAPPVLGAALIGLDEMKAPALAYKRLRAAITHERLTARRR